MQKNGARFALFLLIFTASVGVFAWAQKTEDAPEERGVTLADLGVTEAQKSQIKSLWELKRQRQMQAIENLRALNRLVKETTASDDEISEALITFRQMRTEQEEKIQKVEDELIKTLPPRAQLHLTILGVLENGLTHRFTPSKGENSAIPQNKQ